MKLSTPVSRRRLRALRHLPRQFPAERRAASGLFLLLLSLLPVSISAQEEPLAEDERYLTFERKLQASSKAANRYQIPNELYSMKEAQAVRYFATYFATNTYNYPLFVNLNYPVFHWGKNHRNLQAALSGTFLDGLTDFFETNPDPASVNAAIAAEPRLEHHYFYMLSFFVKLLGAGRLDREALDQTRQDLTALSRKAPFLLDLDAPVSCTCYLAVLSAKGREVWLNDSGIEAFVKGQWQRVADPLATTTPATTEWRWDVFKRRVETAGHVRFPDVAGLDGKTLLIYAFR